ncbi:MAG: hypothetical protein D6B26_03325, partial [Spirochaetaceae bacterium]
MEKAKILYGASIWTGQSGERDSRPAALAIAQGRIAICGSLDECRRAFPGAQEHDMGGGFLMPGFNDNHLHVAAYGASQRMLSLRGLDAKAIIAALQERYSDLPTNRLIIASGWDYDCVPEPTKILLDKAFPKHDVILIQFSGHAAWVNSRMLKKMKITASTPDPAGGVIVRDKDGQATGVLRDAAMQELQKQKFLRQHMRTTLLRSDIKRALEACSAMGICSVQDNTWLPQGVWAYRYLHRKGRLPCRVRCWSYASFAPLRMIMERWVRYIPNWVAAGPRKYFLDGTFSTSTALLAAPYEGQDQY